MRSTARRELRQSDFSSVAVTVRKARRSPFFAPGNRGGIDAEKRAAQPGRGHDDRLAICERHSPHRQLGRVGVHFDGFRPAIHGQAAQPPCSCFGACVVRYATFDGKRKAPPGRANLRRLGGAVSLARGV